MSHRSMRSFGYEDGYSRHCIVAALGGGILRLSPCGKVKNVREPATVYGDLPETAFKGSNPWKKNCNRQSVMGQRVPGWTFNTKIENRKLAWEHTWRDRILAMKCTCNSAYGIVRCGIAFQQ